MNNTEFKKLERDYNQLWMEGKKEEALQKVEAAAVEYPEEEYITLLDRAVLNLELGNTEVAKEILHSAQNKGYWYPRVYLEAVFTEDSFREIASRWQELKAEKEAGAEAEYLLYLPENYNKEKSYPLFVAYHGWGESADFFAYYWKSSRIRQDYILFLPQSSQIIGSRNYCWNDTAAAYLEIEEMLNEVRGKYRIKEGEGIVGGFSQGGALAIDTALNQDFLAVRGFISLCPVKPDNFSARGVKRAAEQGIRGVILTGEHDQSLPQQQEMAADFKEYNLPCRLIIEKALGHWFPADLEEQLDGALDFINE